MTDATPVETPIPVRREHYAPPPWLVRDLELDFLLNPAGTTVRSRLSVTRNGDHDEPLRLDGEELELLSVRVDDADTGNWRMEGNSLVIPLRGSSHHVEMLVVIVPDRNSRLTGLYVSGGTFCTQCEPQGFRRITFFPDRPDVLTRCRVRMTADKALFPILLSNGDKVAAGDNGDGSHWAEWHDPVPKPSYLFALVAGDLVANRARFTTCSGRDVALAVWVRAPDLPRTDHALAAVKVAMKWDEDVYGREYDLDMFNIVAVDDFNPGAMENKGLNIFNSRYTLADPDVATDSDYDSITSIVAHEYFHNWSGNRVTCRDWFQLSLKEGLTIFRDQSFSADQGSPAVKRITDVRALRTAQFREDAGPLAHPVRPDSYIAISNFYTATVYHKGAEIVRMLAVLLGSAGFRQACDLYFARFDGTAATVEDFIACMEEAGGIDLRQFRLWYSQAGTPHVAVSLTYQADTGRALLSLVQTVPDTPGQTGKLPMLLPLRLRLFGADSGRAISDEQLFVLSKARAELVFDAVAERPVLSINRGFSAPVVIETSRSAADLAFLARVDDDPFARFEAMHQLMLDTLVAATVEGKADHQPVLDAIAETLDRTMLDRAFIAEAVSLPSEGLIGAQLSSIDPEAIFRARDALRGDIGRHHASRWHRVHEAGGGRAYAYTAEDKGIRRLRNVALGYIVASRAPGANALAFHRFETSDNMTDRLAALAALVDTYADEREVALDMFYKRYAGNGLVIDKWFQMQAQSTREDTSARVAMLSAHPDFTLANPNRARSLIDTFGANQRAFHVASGAGYHWLADQVLALDALNPLAAAKLLPPLGQWRRVGPSRAHLMRAALERIVKRPGISKDLFEQASKCLE